MTFLSDTLPVAESPLVSKGPSAKHVKIYSQFKWKGQVKNNWT